MAGRSCNPTFCSSLTVLAVAPSVAGAAATWEAEAHWQGRVEIQGRLPTRLLAALAGVRPKRTGPQAGRHTSGRDEWPDSDAAWSSGWADLRVTARASRPCPSTHSPSSAVLAVTPLVATAAATWEAEALGGIATQKRLPVRLLAALIPTPPPTQKHNGHAFPL